MRNDYKSWTYFEKRRSQTASSPELRSSPLSVTMLLHKLLVVPSFSLLSRALSSNHNQVLTRRADAPNQPPANPANEKDCYFQYYKQRIDHFGQHDGTFQQKYNLVTDFYKPGGPIFFYQGEEATYLDCVVSFPMPMNWILTHHA